MESIKKKLLISKLLLIVFLFLSFPISVNAKSPTLDQAEDFLGNAVRPTGLPTQPVQNTVGNIIQVALTMVGTIFFILMVYAGYIWMTARGEEEKITKAREIIIAAIIGLALIVAAYAVTNFITSTAVKSARGS